MKGIFVEIKDIQKLFGCSYKQAWRKMQSYQDIAGSKNVTVEKFCKLESISDNDFYNGVLLRNLRK